MESENKNIQKELSLKLVNNNQTGSVVSTVNKIGVAPGQSIRIEVGSSVEKRSILSPSMDLLKNGLTLLNSGQVLESGEEIILFIFNASPATLSLQSKERGGYPDLSIWNDAGSVILDENFIVCLIKEI